MNVLIDSDNKFFIYAIEEMLRDIFLFNSINFIEAFKKDTNSVTDVDIYVQECTTGKEIHCNPMVKSKPSLLNIVFIDWDIKEQHSKKCTNKILFVNAKDHYEAIRKNIMGAWSKKLLSSNNNNICNSCEMLNITPKDYIIAKLLQAGFSISDIAIALSVNCKTVYSRRNNLKKKLSARSNVNLLWILNTFSTKMK